MLPLIVYRGSKEVNFLKNFGRLFLSWCHSMFSLPPPCFFWLIFLPHSLLSLSFRICSHNGSWKPILLEAVIYQLKRPSLSVPKNARSTAGPEGCITALKGEGCLNLSRNTQSFSPDPSMIHMQYQIYMPVWMPSQEDYSIHTVYLYPTSLPRSSNQCKWYLSLACISVTIQAFETMMSGSNSQTTVLNIST